MELGFLFTFFIHYLIVSIVSSAPPVTPSFTKLPRNTFITESLDPECSNELQAFSSQFVNKTFKFCDRPIVKYSNSDDLPQIESYLCTGIFSGYSRVCEALKKDKTVLPAMEERFLVSGYKPESFCSDMRKIIKPETLTLSEDLADWLKHYIELISDDDECLKLCFAGRSVTTLCRAAYSTFGAVPNPTPAGKVEKAEDPLKVSTHNLEKASNTESGLPEVPKPEESPERGKELKGSLKKESEAPKVEEATSSGGQLDKVPLAAQPEPKTPEEKADKGTEGPKEPGVVQDPAKQEKTAPIEVAKPSSGTKPVEPTYTRDEPVQQTGDETDDAVIQNYQTGQFNQQSEKSDFPAEEENFRDDPSLDETLEFEKKRGPGQVQRQRMNTFDNSDDTNFLPYFLLMVVMSAFGYVAFHNKNKLIALVVEGRRSGGRGRSRSRHGSTLYSKLHSNLEETISSNSAAPTASHVLY